MHTKIETLMSIYFYIILKNFSTLTLMEICATTAFLNINNNFFNNLNVKFGKKIM